MKLFNKYFCLLPASTFIFFLFILAPFSHGIALQALDKNFAFQMLQEDTNGPFMLEIPVGRITYYFNFPMGRLISNSLIEQAIEKRDKQIRESTTFRYLNWLANEGFITFNFSPKPRIAKNPVKKDDEYYMEIVYDFEIKLTNKSKYFQLHEQEGSIDSGFLGVEKLERLEGNYRLSYLKLAEINITKILEINEGKSPYYEGLIIVTYEWKYGFTPIAEGLFPLHPKVIMGWGLFSVMDLKSSSKVKFFELNKETQIRKSGFNYDGEKWLIVMYVDMK